MNINLSRIVNVERFIMQTIENNQIPGAALAIVTKDHVLYENAFGIAHSDKKIPITTKTIFDLASLTKVCATLPSILLLIENGDIDLNDQVSRFLPEFKGKTITIKHLLTHTSGLPASLNFHRKKYSIEEAISEISLHFQAVEPGQKVIYSDLNYILLGFIIELISQMSLNDFTKKFLFEPLEMKDTGFNPDLKLQNRIAATEYREYLNDYQWGTVHDENADAFNGVSGHAGLFSTLGDLAYYVQCILNNGVHKGQQLFSPYLLQATYKNYTKGLGNYRGLGWQLVDEEASPVGRIFPQDSIGHTGFTGTSLWFNPKLDIAVILLTNRVHYGRGTDIIRFRKIVHSLIAMALPY